MAADHGVAGLIYRNAGNAAPDSPLGALWETCPETVRAAFHEQYCRNIARNLYWREELGRLAAACLAEGLRPIVLRGLTFIGSLYPDEGLRSSEDCDLCVRPRDRAKTVQVLGRLGYEPCEGGAHVYSNGRGFVDLHTGLGGEDRLRTAARLHRIDTERVWAEAQSFSTPGGNLLRLSDRDALLVNALHLLKHEYERLIWKLDLAQLILQLTAERQWPVVVSRAEAFRLTIPLACAGAYAEHLFPQRLAGLLATIPYTLPQPLARRVFHWIREERDLGRLSFLILAWMSPRVTDRVRFLAEAVVPGAEVRAGMRAEWEGYGESRGLVRDRLRKLILTVRSVADLLIGR